MYGEIKNFYKLFFVLIKFYFNLINSFKFSNKRIYEGILNV